MYNYIHGGGFIYPIVEWFGKDSFKCSIAQHKNYIQTNWIIQLSNTIVWPVYQSLDIFMKHMLSALVLGSFF